MEISEIYSIFQKHREITTDSRCCPKGSLFFALKGASFNGNDFALKALSLGCAYAFVDEMRAEFQGNGRIVLVDDVLKCLQNLANYHRRQLKTPVIGITGTNGKTTTKELIAAVLQQKYNVLFTQGNFNNHIGVPKTLLSLTEKHEIAVVEMGANHPGEIKTLVNIVEPDMGIITNVGKAHLLGFGSFEGVIRTKGELYDYLREHRRRAFINMDNPYLMGISQGLSLTKYAHEPSDEAIVSGEIVECAPYLHFSWQRKGGLKQDVKTHLIGSYNLDNMLAAATIGVSQGIEDSLISLALASYVPKNNRSQLTRTKVNSLIVDTYNANPTSMRAALENFELMQVTGKMAILGDMGELGAVSQEEHQKVVDFLMKSTIKEVWLVGSEFEAIECPYRKFKDVEAVAAALKDNPVTGKNILIKGSNRVKLFLLPEKL